jgi:peptidoglycan hydrolase-like protein with peptidoglycan-binding domain
MHKTWLLSGSGVLVAVIAATAAVAASTPRPASPSPRQPPANTAKVERGTLSAVVSMAGTLTYRAQPDGSPYPVINRRSGIYTELPENGDHIDCGGVLYRVDGQPVLLLCGSMPAYRALWVGDSGPDVAELNANLVNLGYATSAQLDPASTYFGSQTYAALEKLQSKLGEDVTGTLDLGEALFLPESVRIVKVSGALGGSASPGADVLNATSNTPEVQVALDPSQQGHVAAGDIVRVDLPGNTSVTGKLARLGRVAQLPAGSNSSAGQATIPAFISLDDPSKAAGLDMAPVRVEITTEGVQNALSVPVTALVGKAGGGFAVEVVRAGGRRELVGVKLGLFDTAGGRVQVEGDLHEGDLVVVPSP